MKMLISNLIIFLSVFNYSTFSSENNIEQKHLSHLDIWKKK